MAKKAKAKSKKATKRQKTASKGGWVTGDDGKKYRHRIVAGTAAMAITSDTSAAGAERVARIEKAMHEAIMKAHDDGLGDKPAEIKKRILAAIDKARNE